MGVRESREEGRGSENIIVRAFAAAMLIKERSGVKAGVAGRRGEEEVGDEGGEGSGEAGEEEGASSGNEERDAGEEGGKMGDEEKRKDCSSAQARGLPAPAPAPPALPATPAHRPIRRRHLGLMLAPSPHLPLPYWTS